jgi:hypothetical protein
MKRNFLALSAIVLAVAASSFTVKKTVDVYFIHNSGDQDVRTSYSQTTSAQSEMIGDAVLGWIKIVDDNGTITDTEFDNAFEALDQVNDNLNTLNDDQEGTVSSVYTLEKKAS